jgi:hypothetical protein
LIYCGRIFFLSAERASVKPNQTLLKMPFCGLRREDTPLLKADSTAGLLDDYQSGADSGYDYDTVSTRERDGGTVLSYSNLRGFALAVAFISWVLMALPLMLWILLPLVLIR